MLGNRPPAFIQALRDSPHPLFCELRAAAAKSGRFIYFNRVEALRLVELHPLEPINGLSLVDAANLLGITHEALRIGVSSGKQTHYLALKAIRFKVGHHVYFRDTEARNIISGFLANSNITFAAKPAQRKNSKSF